MTSSTPPISLEDLLTHAAWARRLARSLMADPSAGEDAAQEALLAAWRNPPRLPGPVRPWLRTVLRNQAFKLRLSDGRRRAREATVAAAAEATAPSPEDLLGQLELQRELAAMVVAMPEPYRQAILMRHYEGRSAAEIGRRLGVPAGTVRWRLKEGLDRLRRQLDARHDGDRRRWGALLAPLAAGPPAGGLAPRGRVMALGLLGGGLAAVLGLAVASKDAGPGDSPQPPAPAGPSSAGKAAPRKAMALAANSSCRDELESLGRKVLEAEAAAMKVMLPRDLFLRGRPNQVAETNLGPLLAAIMKGDGAAPPAYTLECRTWACKLDIVRTEAEVAGANEWHGRLQRDPAMKARTLRRIMFVSAGRTRDPLADTAMHRSEVYFSLNQPSGQPTAPDQLLLPPIEAPAAGDGRACAEARVALQARMAQAERDLESSRPPKQRFAMGTPNPALTEEARPEIIRLLNDRALVDCRGQMCAVILRDIGYDEARPKLDGDTGWRLRVHGMATSGNIIYYTMLDPAELAARRWLRGQLDGWRASPEVAACHRRHTDKSGTLVVRVELPAAGQPNADGLLDRLAVVTAGDLAGSKFAGCVATAARPLLERRPPEGTAAAIEEVLLRIPQAR
jgi:RNA polymerase sigma-70 factor (ECF subfamily)